MNESDWSLVLQQAEKARELVADKKSRPEGLQLFDQLATEYPNDGMVYFKRAEAREALDEIELASFDYKRAQNLFSKKLWQDLARSRADFLDKRIASRRVRQRVSRALGARGLELFSVEQSAQGAGEFIKSSPFVSIELARTALVRSVLALEPWSRTNKLRSVVSTGWRERIDALCRRLPPNSRPSTDTIERAKKILSKRDDAVYRSERVTEDEALHAFDALIDFLSHVV